MGAEARAGPSGADPSALVGLWAAVDAMKAFIWRFRQVKKVISHEEDVLHVKDLPTFGNKLKQARR